MSNSTYKPKAGDHIRIVGNTCEHGFPIGSVVLVEGDKVYGDGGVNAVCSDGSNCWALSRRDFVPAKPTPTTPKATKEPKMPAKPKPALVNPVAPKPEPRLYKAIRDRLETKDKETLHARTKKAVEAVEYLLEGVQPAADVSGPSETVVASVVPTRIPWSLEGLVVDPDPKESIGKVGWFWDAGDCGGVQFGVGADPEHSFRKYQTVEDMSWDHFAYIPNFPGAELLKRTTGYEIP